MNNVKDKPVKIMLDKEREMLFTLNVLVDVQDEYGDVIEVFSKAMTDQDFKVIRMVMHAALKEDDPELTVEQVGRMITMTNLPHVIEALTEAIGLSTPEEVEGKTPVEPKAKQKA